MALEQKISDIIGLYVAGRKYPDRKDVVTAIIAEIRAERSNPVGDMDRPAILAAARAWWAANMPMSICRSIQISGDGRVNVHWQDADESGKYTLPVGFFNRSNPGADVERLRVALEPFARLADIAELGRRWAADTGFTVMHHHYFVGSITLRELQDAREALAPPTRAENAQVRGDDDFSPQRIFDHKWLDPECIYKGCKSLLPRRLAEEIAQMPPPDDPHTDAWMLGFCRARKMAADHISAALTATPQAPAGGVILGGERRFALRGPFARELEIVWCDFLTANPDGLTSPEYLPDHALMTGAQFEEWAMEAFDRVATPDQPAENAKCSGMDERVLSMRSPMEIPHAIELWFFTDLSETQRRQLINWCGFPGVEANGEDFQRQYLRAILAALSAQSGGER